MSVLLLNEDEVRQILSMDMALEAVENGLRKVALDEGQNVPRARTQTDHAMQHVMSASAKTLGYMGYKAYATSRKGAQFHVGLFDGKTGALLALIQADHGAVRRGPGRPSRLMARQTRPISACSAAANRPARSSRQFAGYAKSARCVCSVQMKNAAERSPRP